MIPSLSLEITVLLLGILMLLVESFSRSDDKRGLAKMAIGIAGRREEVGRSQGTQALQPPQRQQPAARLEAGFGQLSQRSGRRLILPFEDQAGGRVAMPAIGMFQQVDQGRDSASRILDRG